MCNLFFTIALNSFLDRIIPDLSFTHRLVLLAHGIFADQPPMVHHPRYVIILVTKIYIIKGCHFMNKQFSIDSCFRSYALFIPQHQKNLLQNRFVFRLWRYEFFPNAIFPPTFSHKKNWRYLRQPPDLWEKCFPWMLTRKTSLNRFPEKLVRENLNRANQNTFK